MQKNKDIKHITKDIINDINEEGFRMFEAFTRTYIDKEAFDVLKR